MHPSRAFKHWLSAQCQMFGNVNSAVLINTSSAPPQVLGKWPEDTIETAQLSAIVNATLEKQRLQLIPLENDLYLFGHPLAIDGAPWGVLSCVLHLPDKKVLPALLKSLKLGQFWLQFSLQLLATTKVASDQEAGTRQSASASIIAQMGNDSSGDINAAVLQAYSALLKENSLTETCITLVNLLAGLLQARRVSVGLLDSRGKNVAIEAVSFSANVDQRTRTMLAVRDAMMEAIDLGMRIDCFAQQDNQASQPTFITQAHQQLRREQQAQAISSVLLRRGEAILGAVTIELERGKLSADEEFLLQHIIHSAAAVIYFQQHANQGFFRAVKLRLLAGFEQVFGKHAWRKKLAALAMAIFLSALFIPVDYQVSAPANLQTTEKYLVVSPQDAYLGSINARPGDTVKKGAVLAQLNDEDLRLERRKLASQAQQYRQAYDSALANSNRVEAAIANAQLEQASIQLQLLDQQLARSQLLAPVDGIVVSDDIAQTRGAPVKQGDVLFEIATAEHYFAQLWVDERDIAQLQPGQAGELKLTSMPGQIFTSRVKAITPISEVRDGRNYFRVELALDDAAAKTPANLRPGMTGVGKVNAGRRLLGWVWFHDIWHWLRLSWW